VIPQHRKKLTGVEMDEREVKEEEYDADVHAQRIYDEARSWWEALTPQQRVLGYKWHLCGSNVSVSLQRKYEIGVMKELFEEWGVLYYEQCEVAEKKTGEQGTSIATSAARSITPLVMAAPAAFPAAILKRADTCSADDHEVQASSKRHKSDRKVTINTKLNSVYLF